MSEKKVTRRSYLKYAGAAVVVGAVAAAGYGAYQYSQPAPTTPRSSPTTPTPTKEAKLDWRQFSGETITVISESVPPIMGLNKLLGEFEELSGIKVEIQTFPWPEHMAKQQLALVAKKGTFDVGMIWINQLGNYIANGWVEPLDSYINDKTLTDPRILNLDDFFPRLKIESHGFPAQKEWYVIPFRNEVIELIYNTRLFKEAGVSPPDTYDDLEKAAKALTKLPDHAGIAMRTDKGSGALYMWAHFLKSFGGDFFDKNTFKPTVNSDIAVKSLELYARLIQNYGPVEKKITINDIGALMGQAKTAMILDASAFGGWMADPKRSKVMNEVGYALPPKGPVMRAVGNSTNSMMINRFSEKKKAAWLFIQWAASADTQLKISLISPATESPRPSVWKSPEFDAMVKGWGNFREMTLNALEEAQPWFRPPFKNAFEWFLHIGEAIESTVLGATTAKQALDKANEAILKSQIANGIVKE